MSNPYETLPEANFWKKAVFERRDNIIPKMKKNFKIAPGQKLATAGSCFAQNLAKHLQNKSYLSFLKSEPLRDTDPVFSGRYGNIYTAQQLLQLFNECETGAVDENSAVLRPDGRYVDANRPYISKEGFDNAASVIEARKEHIKAVKSVFYDADIFVFTLGLTEAWKSRNGGRVFPVCPGVYSDDPNFDYEFVNYGFSEVKAAMSEFVHRVSLINPGIRILLTVSPVPLTATYTDEHVLVATTHSKSVLRAVCSELTAEHKNVYYFPSYEMISNPYTEHSSYETGNLRVVKAEEIEKVMAFFDSEYISDAEHPAAELLAAPSENIETESAAENDVFCDDLEIEKSMGF